MTKRRRPRGQDHSRMLTHGVDSSDFIKLMERTEFNFEKTELVTEPEDFVENEIDNVIGEDEAKYIFENASSTDKSYYSAPSTFHCGNDIEKEITCHISDWLVDRLL